ncbi:MAG: type IV pilus modification PilV family protein [Bryobacteraceae bacterium]
MRARGRGFTLLEVLVATLILGVAVTGLLGALRASMANAARLTESQRAVALARRQMDELLATRELPKGTPIEGLFSPAETGGVEAGWRALVLPFEGLVTEPGAAPVLGTRILNRIELEVWWRQGGARRSLKIAAYRGAFMRPEDARFFEQMQDGTGEGGAR